MAKVVTNNGQKRRVFDLSKNNKAYILHRDMDSPQPAPCIPTKTLQQQLGSRQMNCPQPNRLHPDV